MDFMFESSQHYNCRIPPLPVSNTPNDERAFVWMEADELGRNGQVLLNHAGDTLIATVMRERGKNGRLVWSGYYVYRVSDQLFIRKLASHVSIQVVKALVELRYLLSLPSLTIIHDFEGNNASSQITP